MTSVYFPLNTSFALCINVYEVAFHNSTKLIVVALPVLLALSSCFMLIILADWDRMTKELRISNLK